MSGALFLILGITATIVTIWQVNLLAGFFGSTRPPDYALAGISFTAAIIFFGLWLAGGSNEGKSKARDLSD